MISHLLCGGVRHTHVYTNSNHLGSCCWMLWWWWSWRWLTCIFYYYIKMSLIKKGGKKERKNFKKLMRCHFFLRAFLLNSKESKRKWEEERGKGWAMKWLQLVRLLTKSFCILCIYDTTAIMFKAKLEPESMQAIHEEINWIWMKEWRRRSTRHSWLFVWVSFFKITMMMTRGALNESIDWKAHLFNFHPPPPSFQMNNKSMDEWNWWVINAWACIDLWAMMMMITTWKGAVNGGRWEPQRKSKNNMRQAWWCFFLA